MNEGISVRTCNAKDIDTLVSLGIKTFRDSFDEFNSPENMILCMRTKAILEKVLDTCLCRRAFLMRKRKYAPLFGWVSGKTTPGPFPFMKEMVLCDLASTRSCWVTTRKLIG